ncbi:hypothetical protein AUC43_15065 [Hymenobacter sedentarius]|uniref:Uncharacterized protein n=1 Tax=Hymenobacter sedentarius TaxID=1411621 RepID=A0A0U4CSA4_9BACT|nr:hypothetical protein AUC43_15065 [Hymenobacter sedentarius]
MLRFRNCCNGFLNRRAYRWLNEWFGLSNNYWRNCRYWCRRWLNYSFCWCNNRNRLRYCRCLDNWVNYCGQLNFGGFGWLHFLNEAAQQGAVGGVGGSAAQALAGQHGALVVGRFGQQEVGRLAVGKSLGQLLQFAHFYRAKGRGVVQYMQKRGASHGKWVALTTSRFRSQFLKPEPRTE